MRRWYCNAMRESRSPPPFNEEPQISKDFWGFFDFLPADLFLLRCFFSSRWILVCHADFADDADFFSLIILVPQISQIYTDFFHWLFFSWGFTQIFSGSLLSLSFLLFPVISSFFLSFLYFADFRPVGLGGWRRFLLSWTRKGLCRFSLIFFFLWVFWRFLLL